MAGGARGIGHAHEFDTSALHLAANPPARIVITHECPEGHVDAEVFSAFRVIEKAPGEEHLASTLHLGDGHHLITRGAKQTAAQLEAAGFELTTIDMSEFQAADGGLTCLSVLIPPHR